MELLCASHFQFSSDVLAGYVTFWCTLLCDDITNVVGLCNSLGIIE